ncbi:MAG: HAD-IIIA family hydrolase [Lachnospiraceae bacterium]|jgi:3-deoxy-D-manno-octulosonate 8-phosphate phosphatase (KDO 8-P phosphatase)|nr:HAD-IIIA family hydrolase [Lachnospiraceae bacterium]
MSDIKFLVMDVDGTMTDGKIYMGPTGEMFKAFDIKDGCGIFLVLPKMGIIPVVITARKSEIVERRCEELNISEIHQGSKDKLATLNMVLERYGADLGSVAYMGDDLPDIPCMEAVKCAGGLVLCPADAINEITSIADYVSRFNAGNGAVRDCIEYLKTL